MVDMFLTAQDMDKLGKAPRRAYIEKQGLICADVPYEGRNKRYSYPMAFKWGFLSFFDSIYNINTASAISENIMYMLPQLIDGGENRDDGMRAWILMLDNSICFTGFSYNELYMPQPEEQEKLTKFTIFSMQYCPDFDIDIWSMPIPKHVIESARSSGTFSFKGPLSQIDRFAPKYLPKGTTLAKSVSVHCVSDIFEGIASKLDVNPYELASDDFRSLTKQVKEIKIEDIIFYIK